jgi:hypothetical protein
MHVLGTFELVQKRHAKLGECREWSGGVRRTRVAGYGALVRAVHDRYESIRRGLRSDVRTGEVALEHVANEGRVVRNDEVGHQESTIAVQLESEVIRVSNLLDCEACVATIDFLSVRRAPCDGTLGWLTDVGCQVAQLVAGDVHSQRLRIVHRLRGQSESPRQVQQSIAECSILRAQLIRIDLRVELSRAIDDSSE